MQQTIRLILLNAFTVSEPEVTQQIQDLYNHCPTLFDSLLPRSEQTHFQDANDDEDSVAIQGSPNHLHPMAISRIQPKYCRNVLKLSIKAQDFDVTFKKCLRLAYELDYGLPGIIHFGHAFVPWCTKFSFTDR